MHYLSDIASYFYTFFIFSTFRSGLIIRCFEVMVNFTIGILLQQESTADGIGAWV